MECKKCDKQGDEKLFATFKGRDGTIRRRGVCWECRGKYAYENFERLQTWRKTYNIKQKNKKRERDANQKKKAKAFTDKFKSEHPCTDCGRFFPPVAMDFDHIKAKNKNVASMVSQGYRLELIEREMELCELVCACCHRVRTAARKDTLSTGYEKLPHVFVHDSN